MLVLIFAIIGLIVSLYTFHIENSLKKNKDYRSICDFSIRISCSRAISSRYGRFFGIHNSILGITLYVAIIMLFVFNLNYMVLYLSLIAVIGSLFFAYLQYNMRTFCLICTLTYLINIILLIVSLSLN
ncbi:hypothetical protein HYT23_01190 [Candidatus Pacearchaeota archaeon]|nr:hypothetical protein [Candidatus Pacearchaeota archaeon]